MANAQTPSFDHATDWDLYYRYPAKTASITRRITSKRLVRTIRRHTELTVPAHFAELGGAGSCFFEALDAAFAPAHYTVVDNNMTGLGAFTQRVLDIHRISALKQDLLEPFEPIAKADLVFSVGLIEHFPKGGTQKVIDAHFAMVKPGGIVLLSFPTPTWLYRISRKVIELFGLWIFHDERPLGFDEVLNALPDHATVLEKSIIWPIFLTQGLVVVRAGAH